MKKSKAMVLTILYLIMATAISCVKDDSTNRIIDGNEEWLIPADRVFDGGPGKDGIPAINSPDFTVPENATYLSDNDLVLGIVYDGDARAYPHKILDWHEIVNDTFEDKAIAVIYCPLTGTGTGWNRNTGGKTTTFGVSGLLYNSNIIPYDRETGSNWSQMLLKAVSGSLIGTSAETSNLVETTWETWRNMYPETIVLSNNTGYSRDYRRYPYGDYRTNSSIIFPVSNSDDRLHPKERVLGVLIDGRVKAYSIENFGSQISLINDTFNGRAIVIAGSKQNNFIVAFEAEASAEVLPQFTAVQNSLPVVMQDSEGTKYDVFGRAVEGPGTGEQLLTITQFMGYWFAWAAFYPEIGLY